MYVIGTAGHVDHGKSTLVEALTGIHPDRLREEQQRGLTIELGFAWFTLPSGREVSVVDVPGHVRFVRHMLAGVGAIDLALFVVAADEGVMPQTREHLEILDLLELRHGVVALTKCDLVEEDWADLVEEELLALLDSTSLAGAPVVRVSAATGRGLDELREALDRALDAAPEPRDVGRPRLGIDRVFTMPGFGTVVTGTLLDGRLRVGDSVEAVPGGPTARIRGLQTHRAERDEAEPGTRVAVNLAGVSTEQLRRGQVLAQPGRLAPVQAFDARVRVLAHRALRHNLRVTVHAGSAEVQGRVRVLGATPDEGGGTTGLDEIPPEAEGWAQLVLRQPLAIAPGDLFVLRVSDQTVAGGRVVETNPPRYRRADPATLERLQSRASGTPESRVLAALERLEPCLASALVSALARDTAESAGSGTAAEALRALVDQGLALALPPGEGREAGTEPVYLTAAGFERLNAQAARALEGYEREHPLRFAMPREELRSRLALGQREFAALLTALTAAEAPRPSTEGQQLALTAAGVSRAGWTPKLTAAQRRSAEEVVATLAAGATAPPRLDLDGELVAYLVGSGQAVDCGDGVVLASAAFEEACRLVVERLRGGASATLAELRDALGTNRRAAQAILETLDRRGVTRRAGDARVLHEQAG